MSKEKLEGMAKKSSKGKYPGWRTMSSASRYNAKMHHTFEEGKRLNAIHDEGRAKHVKAGHGDVSTYGGCKKCHTS